jgi:hypothetical protein
VKEREKEESKERQEYVNIMNKQLNVKCYYLKHERYAVLSRASVVFKFYTFKIQVS